MGGYGSGGWNASGRPTTADVPCLNVRRLHRLGLLTGNHEGTLRWHTRWLDESADFVVHGDHIRVIHGTEPLRYCDDISIEWEDCRFGGQRPFFVCPDCGRRTLHLYRMPGFKCRTCHGLSYPSQRERESDRAQRRANRIRVRLGGDPGWTNIPPRPKGMHWRTYERQIARIVEADAITDCYAAERFGLSP